MKITIIYDNTAYIEGLRTDWGFSCLVEASPGENKILFDTGANGSILLSNMAKLNIDPKSINTVFLSHAHFDHIGGLSSFLNVNSNVKIYAPPSLRGIRDAKEVIYADKPLTISENVFSTGEIDNIEQSLAVKTDKGIVLITGCSHPKMERIIKAASQFGKVYSIAGGLHGFNEFELFKDIDLICPCHCTQHIAEIKSLYPAKFIEGGVGRVIEF